MRKKTPLFFPQIAAQLLVTFAFFWCEAVQADTHCSDSSPTGIPANAPDSRYLVDGLKGLVTDNITGLVWKQCIEGRTGIDCSDADTPATTTFSWGDALERAKTSSFAGYDDWRLPNTKELSSIIERCRSFPAINTSIFKNTPSASAWTGSPVSDDSDAAWTVDFEQGHVLDYEDRDFLGVVRLVRGGQSLIPRIQPVSLQLHETGPGAVEFAATSNVDSASVCWLIVRPGSPPPTSAQVKGSSRYDGQVVRRGCAPMATGSTANVSAPGLSGGDYDLYVIAEGSDDALSHPQQIAFNVSPASPTPIPTLSDWAVWLVFALLMLTAVRYTRPRQA